MIFSFGPEADSPLFSGQRTAVNKEHVPASPQWATNDLGPFWDPFDNIS